MSHNHLRGLSEIQDPCYYIQSDPSVTFVGAIAVNDVTFESIVGILKTPRIKIVGLYIVSVQNLPWSVWFASTHNTGMGEEPFQGRYDFNAADGRQIAGAGVFYYDRPVTRVFPPMPYEAFSDESNRESPTTFRMGLSVNGGGVAKLANAPGAISIKFLYVPAGE